MTNLCCCWISAAKVDHRKEVINSRKTFQWSRLMSWKALIDATKSAYLSMARIDMENMKTLFAKILFFYFFSGNILHDVFTCLEAPRWGCLDFITLHAFLSCSFDYFHCGDIIQSVCFLQEKLRMNLFEICSLGVQLYKSTVKSQICESR